ncbi:unnamed protein product, partial [Durusdinium trenchii]
MSSSPQRFVIQVEDAMEAPSRIGRFDAFALAWRHCQRHAAAWAAAAEREESYQALLQMKQSNWLKAVGVNFAPPDRPPGRSSGTCGASVGVPSRLAPRPVGDGGSGTSCGHGAASLWLPGRCPHRCDAAAGAGAADRPAPRGVTGAGALS